MANLSSKCRLLIKGLNYQYQKNITFTTKQFVGREGRIHTYYIVSESAYDLEKKKYISNDIFSSGSMIDVIMFLRDLLFIEQNKLLPTDSENWNEKRAKALEKVNVEVLKNGKYRKY